MPEAEALPTVQQFLDSWELFRDPVLAAALAGGLLGWLGVYVVVRRMVFLSAALAQAAGLGVAAAWYAQIHLGAPAGLINPTIGAVISTILAAGGLLSARGGALGRSDGVLGWVYLLGAAGTLALGTRIVQEVQDIQSILFGTAVAVSPEDLHLLLWLAAVLGAIHLVGLRGFVQVAVDEDGARVRGLPTRWLSLALVGSLAAAVSLATRVLGALPVFAFTVLPPMAGLRLAPHVAGAAAVSALLGALAGVLGYLVAFLYRLPVGASQALVAGAGLILAHLLAWGLDRLHHWQAHRHGHIHSPGCGHLAVRHGDHVDYLHDGRLDHTHGDRHEIHTLQGPPDHGRAHQPAETGHPPQHNHGPLCGHPQVAHDDHIDYLVAGRLHHPHGDHCDDHGALDVVDG